MDANNQKWNASLYVDKHAFVYEYGEDLIRLLDVKEGEEILDIGCGTGQLTAVIKQQGAFVTGLDASQDMIEKACDLYPDIAFKVANVADFTLQTPVDAIFSNATLHWVLDYQEAAKCMYNALKPNGRLVVEFGGKGNVDMVISTLKKVLKDYGYFTNAKIQPWFFPSISAYTAVLENIGFTVTLAQLYDRPTLLADSKKGIEDWLQMFATSFFEGIPEAQVVAICKEVQNELYPFLYKNDNWYADYKRLRVIAVKL
ncbi:class I SAM-dependent methyltransferase [Neptunitalea lumnitzerae]|uniref:SAM-dependent methyltransferase n=1 Tax=Neptunitalea lumnitzerae TaxID=2965509 RepID=A0ABQ5ML43_9FLAO|nr:methyltransferase domain-containing protein [Neptunitalea sp. Y10]GLB50128.1 SAM-dependent methyltransferase [Neptunitalea sp. Y10]